MATHPSSDALRRFMLGKLSKEGSREIVRHLLEGCVDCVHTTGSQWRRMEAALLSLRSLDVEAKLDESGSYDVVFERAFLQAQERHAEMTRERLEATSLCEELLRHPATRMITLAKNSKRFQTWAVCEQLLDIGFEYRFNEPSRYLQLTRVAIELVGALDAKRYGSRPLNDLRARGCAHLGNSQRILSELRDAEASFALASRLLGQGTGDPIEKALCTRLHAQVALDRGQFELALRRFTAVRRIYESLGEKALASRVLISMAKARVDSGEPEISLQLLEQALVQFEEQQDARRIALTRHNMARCLHDLGKYREALDQLAVVEPLYQDLGDRLTLVRVVWLRGRIYCSTRRYQEAERAFGKVRKVLAQKGIAYDAALVSLDLAMVYAAQGRTTEMRQLAEEMLPIFQSRDVHREAMAALIIFRQAVEAEQVTLGLVKEVAAFLEKAQKNRKLRFRPSS